jgi:hypothetical protein
VRPNVLGMLSKEITSGLAWRLRLLTEGEDDDISVFEVPVMPRDAAPELPKLRCWRPEPLLTEAQLLQLK